MRRLLTLFGPFVVIGSLAVLVVLRDRAGSDPIAPADVAAADHTVSPAVPVPASIAEGDRARRPDEVAHAAAGDSKSDTDDGPAFGAIRGIVVDRLSRGVHPVTVALFDTKEGDREIERCLTTADGRFAFQVRAGTYALRVDERSLPEELAPPWKQRRSMRLHEGRPAYGPGYYAPAIEVPDDGGEFFVELRLFSTSIVAGYVRGQDGQPIEGAIVSVVSRAGTAPPDLSAMAVTDAMGRYEMAGVYPGRYRTDVYLREVEPPRFRTVTPPLPERVDVGEGDVVEVPILIAGGGSAVIEGRIVDQDGAPFEGLTVLCHLDRAVEADELPYGWAALLAHTKTDAEGRFVLGDLPSVRVKVQAGSDDDYAPNLPVQRRRAAFWVYPVSVDLRDAVGRVMLPSQRVDRSRPFVVRGRIELDEEWAKEHGMRMSLLDAQVELMPPGAPIVDGPRRPSYDLGRLDIDRRTGEFVWACETPHPPVRVSVLGKGAYPVELVLEPEPNVTVEHTFRFPW